MNEKSLIKFAKYAGIFLVVLGLMSYVTGIYGDELYIVIFFIVLGLFCIIAPKLISK